MDLVSAADLRAADAAAARQGVPPETLMEAAGRAVLEALRAAWPEVERLVIACGPGNNGGDGFVLARLATLAGLRVTTLELPPARRSGGPEAGRPERRRRREGATGAAAAARRAWEAQGDIAPLGPESLDAALREADAAGPRRTVLVDALFGSGLARPLDGVAAEVVERLNAWDGPVLAVDVPSGVAADAARPPGPHVRATRTLQLAAAVPASALPPARFAFGAWTVADIGLPPDALPHPSGGSRPRLMTDAAARDALPSRERDAHKYDAGTVLVVAGSRGYAGAAELVCRGAHRGGAGLVTLVTDAPHPARWPETIVRAVAAGGSLAEDAAAVDARHGAARVLGPGLEPDAVAALAPLLENDDAPTVLDASALVPDLREAARLHGGCWLTPHAGEAARLLEVQADEIAADPIEAAVTLALAWRAGVVLKSAGAVVAGPDGRVRIVVGGGPALASGGTGDVLAGLLGALLAAPGGDATERVAAGVHLHARAGERAARRLGLGLRASDVAEAVPAARRRLGGAW